MAHIARLFAVIAGLLLVAGAAAFLFFRSSMASEGVYRVAHAVGLDAAPPERHIVPEGFQGWAVVHYGVEGAPPLRHEDDALIVEYPASGRRDTSSPAPEHDGFIQRGYYMQTVDGLAPLSRAGDIWGEFSHRLFADDDAASIHQMLEDGASVSIHRSTGFFVGPMRDFMATEWPVEHRLPAGASESEAMTGLHGVP
jgi:hypothetical protein